MLYGKNQKRTRKLQIWVTTTFWEVAADWQLAEDMLCVSVVLGKVHTLKFWCVFFFFKNYFCTIILLFQSKVCMQYPSDNRGPSVFAPH